MAVTIARRPFLPGEEGLWVEIQAGKLREVLVRGLDCLADVSMRNREAPLAIQHASEVVRLEPFRETGYQRLMQAHAMLGNRAKGHRVYERCRTLLREEVGFDPSPELEALYLILLHLPSSGNQEC